MQPSSQLPVHMAVYYASLEPWPRANTERLTVPGMPPCRYRILIGFPTVSKAAAIRINFVRHVSSPWATPLITIKRKAFVRVDRIFCIHRRNAVCDQNRTQGYENHAKVLATSCHSRRPAGIDRYHRVID